MEGSQPAATAAAAAASGSQSAQNPRSNEPEWRTRIFRKSGQQGWEALHGKISTTTTTTTTTTSKSKTTVLPKKNGLKKTMKCWFRASPRVGCIVVRRLRLRVSICPDTVVTRRGNRIMIRPKQGIRVLILLFPTADDCRAFSDCFVALNPHAMVSDAAAAAALGNTAARPGHPVMAAAVAARAITPTPTSQQHLQAGMNKPSVTTNSLIPTTHGADDKNAIMAYIARLLQDEDFSDYVQSMESILISTQDGAKMLDDFVQDNDFISRGWCRK
jgi:hypothetical protein